MKYTIIFLFFCCASVVGVRIYLKSQQAMGVPLLPENNTLPTSPQERPDITKFNPQVVIPTPFPPIKKIPIVAADKAEKHLGNSDLVLGVVIGHQSRAYPISMLCGAQREIMNDELGGKKIATTW